MVAMVLTVENTCNLNAAFGSLATFGLQANTTCEHKKSGKRKLLKKMVKLKAPKKNEIAIMEYLLMTFFSHNDVTFVLMSYSY